VGAIALNGAVADEVGWKRRARRAEADREAQRAIAFSTSLKLDARVLELERDLDEKTSSLSWRLTEPLRALKPVAAGAVIARTLLFKCDISYSRSIVRP